MKCNFRGNEKIIPSSLMKDALCRNIIFVIFYVSHKPGCAVSFIFKKTKTKQDLSDIELPSFIMLENITDIYLYILYILYRKKKAAELQIVVSLQTAI